MDDLISRQAAIEALGDKGLITAMIIIDKIPSTQPALYGYNIGHLVLIANMLEKENLPPERVSEMLLDIASVVDMIRNEFEETLRKAVEQCKI